MNRLTAITLSTRKHKTCTLTESGVKKAEAWFNVENLADADNMTLRHYIDGAHQGPRCDARVIPTMS